MGWGGGGGSLTNWGKGHTENCTIQTLTLFHKESWKPFQRIDFSFQNAFSVPLVYHNTQSNAPQWHVGRWEKSWSDSGSYRHSKSF